MIVFCILQSQGWKDLEQTHTDDTHVQEVLYSIVKVRYDKIRV